MGFNSGFNGLNTGFKQKSMCNHQYTGLIFKNTHRKFLKNLVIFSFLPSASNSLISLSDIPACCSWISTNCHTLECSVLSPYFADLDGGLYQPLYRQPAAPHSSSHRCHGKGKYQLRILVFWDVTLHHWVSSWRPFSGSRSPNTATHHTRIEFSITLL